MRGVVELFKYLVSKKVEPIDGLQSSFSQAHGAVKTRMTEHYTSPMTTGALSVVHATCRLIPGGFTTDST